MSSGRPLTTHLCSNMENMKNSDHEVRSTRLHPTGLISGNSKPKWALCANNAFFQTIMNREATTTDHLTSMATSAADTNAGATTLDEMAQDMDHSETAEIRSETCP